MVHKPAPLPEDINAPWLAGKKKDEDLADELGGDWLHVIGSLHWASAADRDRASALDRTMRQLLATWVAHDLTRWVTGVTSERWVALILINLVTNHWYQDPGANKQCHWAESWSRSFNPKCSNGCASASNCLLEAVRCFKAEAAVNSTRWRPRVRCSSG